MVADKSEARRPGDWKRTTGWILLGVGGASLIAGVACAAVAKQRADEYDEGLRAGKLHTDLADIKNSGVRFQNASWATLAISGVGLAAGAGLLLYSYFSSEKTRTAPIRAIFLGFPSGAGVLCELDF